MSARLESGLLLTARILVLMLPLCLLGGRVAREAALSFSQAAPWLRFLIFAAALEAWVLDELWMRRLLWSVTGVVTFVAADVWLQYATGTDLFGHPRPNDELLSGPFDGPRAWSFIAKLMFPVVLGAFLWQAWQRPAK